MNNDEDLRDLLRTLDPKARTTYAESWSATRPTVPIASRLMRSRDENGQDWADIVDFLTMYPDARRQVARVLGEIEAR